MPISHDVNGTPFLEPRHTNLRQIAVDLGKMEPDAVGRKYSLTGPGWREATTEMAALYRQGAGLPGRRDLINAAVNNILADHALCFPPYARATELHTVSDLVNQVPPDIASAQKLIFSIVMDPGMRALQLVGHFMKLPPFDEFAYLIDAAALSFYRGNTPSAFMTIVPVAEGILLRWRGYPDTLAQKPSFRDTLKFIADTATRQPLPLLPLFFDSWVQAAATIIREHLYRSTRSGSAADHFNRHLALHLLEDRRFGTQANVAGAFLLIDILSELYVCEKRMRDPRWDTEHLETQPHTTAYTNALRAQATNGQPERILTQTHAKCQ